MGHLSRAALALRRRRDHHPPRPADRGARGGRRRARARTRTGSPGRRSGAAAGNSAATYYACLLLVEFGALATFFARDAILFFVAFEVVLVPMWVLISRFGDDHATERARADASNRFVLFTALGSTLMLLGILVLVVQSGHLRPRPARRRPRGGALDPDPGRSSRPSWSSASASRSRSGRSTPGSRRRTRSRRPPGSVLLAAVLLKMGTYGIIRLAIPTVPEGFAAVAPFLAAQRRRRHHLGRPGLPGRARPQAAGRLQLGRAHGLRRPRPRVRHPDRDAGGALRATSPTGWSRRSSSSWSVGSRSAGAAPTSPWPATPCATCPRGWGSRSSSGSPPRLGLPGLVGFWGEFLAVYAAWNPADGLPIPLFRICAVAGVLGMSLAAAYSLRVLRLVWAGHENWTGPAPGMPHPQPAIATTPTVRSWPWSWRSSRWSSVSAWCRSRSWA